MNMFELLRKNLRLRLLTVLISVTFVLILAQAFNLTFNDSASPSELNPDDLDSYKNIEQSLSQETLHKDQKFDLESIDAAINYRTEFIHFLNHKLFKQIQEARPQIGHINNNQHFKEDNKFRQGSLRVPRFSSNFRENKATDFVLTKEYLTSFLQVSDEEKAALKKSHDQFKANMIDSFPEEIDKRFQGNGIIYVGGGKYNWMVLVSLKRLRETGSTTPVEIFIPNENEYSFQFCDVIFPSLGAKCIVMSGFITLPDFHIRRFGLKLLALMLTSFENVLMLDSDNVAVQNPDHLFMSEVYQKNGLVLWPDFWRRSTSPHLYEIAGIHVNETKQVRFSYGDSRDHPIDLDTVQDYNTKVSYHDLEGTLPEASSETGQLLINKKKHAQTLMLAFYYNYYGPEYYYILLGQGQAGEGDKDSFMFSAHELELPWYQVNEYVREFDKNTAKKGEKLGHVSSMGQYDPDIDYKQFSNPDEFKFDDSGYDPTKYNYNRHRFANSSILFLHCLSPKLTLIPDNAEDLINALVKPMTEKYRIYGDYLVEELGYDFEIKIWQTLQWILCQHGEIDPVLNKDKRFTCETISEQVRFLENDLID